MRFAILLSAIGLIMPFWAHAQLLSQQSLYYGYEAIYGNPAQLLNRGTTVQVLSLGAHAQSFASLEELGELSGDTLFFRSAKIAAQADATNAAGNRVGFENLSIGPGVNFRRDNWQWGIGTAFVVQGRLAASAQAMELLSLGNYRSSEALGNCCRVEIPGLVQSYGEVSGHFAYAFENGLSLGGRLRVLSGSSLIDIPEDNFLQVNYLGEDQRYETEISGSVDAYTVGYDVDLNAPSISQDINPFELGKGLGFGTDLGLVWRLNSRLEWGLAIKDLGFIRWNDARRHRLQPDGVYVLSGPSGSVFADSFVYRYSLDEIVDSLQAGLQLSTEDAAITSRLSPKLNAHIRWQFAEASDLGISAQWLLAPVFEADGVASAVLSHRFGELLYLSGSLSYYQFADENFLGFGARAHVSLDPVQVFASVEQLPGLF